MSRIGKVPIPVPQGVDVRIKGSEVMVKGPKGELSRCFSPAISISLNGDSITVSRPTDNRVHRSLHGLTRALLANMVEGVSQGFQKTMDLVGVGYRAQMAGERLVLQVGYSHQVVILPPAGVSVEVVGANRVNVRGIDKELVGDVAAKIRSVRPPDSYKGKGIRYAGEVIHLKPGKSGKVSTRKR